MIEEFQAAAAELPLSQLVKLVLDKTGLAAAVTAEDAAEGTDRAANVSEMLNKAAGFESSEEPTLAAFLEEVALVADIDDHSDSDDVIALMTLHSSKGLEFDTVFLPGLEEGIFPTYRAITDPEKSGLEEERRLCYVGITRAERRLYISAARRRMVNGETTYLSPSRFIKEIPPELFGATPKPEKPQKPAETAAKRPSLKSDTTMEANFGKKWSLASIKKK